MVKKTDVATTKELRDLIEQQGFKCALSGWELTPQTASPDHIRPWSESQDDTIQNLHIVHEKINRAKGTLSKDEFIEMCEAVSSHTAES